MNDLEFRQLVERVKLTLPIEEVVAARVPALKRAGSVWKACCPFHEEKTPSFVVTPARGTWRCFGACGEGGDAISFVEKFDGVPFWDALEELARDAGVELPKKGRARDQDPRMAALASGLERAESHFKKKLNGPDGAEAVAYLAERGIEPTAIEAFGLGWAPAGNALTGAARSAGFDAAALIDGGLARRRDDGSLYDFFRSRLMIPIRDHMGRVVGFGGRLLPGAEGPKYVNTPETALFKKGRIFYGLERALEHVRAARHLLLMEGYTDVIAAHQVGLNIAAAVLGTATTEDHARLVRKSGARRVTLVFDADDAGRRAVSKALSGLLTLDEVTLDVLSLPEGNDPCDFLIEHGEAAFRQRLDDARPWFDFLVDGLDGLEPEPLARGVHELLELLDRLSSAIERDSRMTLLAERLGLSPDAIRDEWRAIQASRRAPRRTRTAAAVRHSDQVGAQAESPEASLARNSTESLDVQSTPRLTPAEQRRERLAWGELAGSFLLDNGLIAVHRELVEGALGGDGASEAAGDLACPLAEAELPDDLVSVFKSIFDLYDNGDPDQQVNASALLTYFGDAPIRRIPVNLEDHALGAESPRSLGDGAVRRLLEMLNQRAAAREQAAASDEMERLRAVDRRRSVQSSHHNTTTPGAIG